MAGLKSQQFHLIPNFHFSIILKREEVYIRKFEEFARRKTGRGERGVSNPFLYGFEVQEKTRFSGVKALLTLSQPYP